MTRTRVLKPHSLQWLQILFLGAVLAFGVHHAHAQMTGNVVGDLSIINRALVATVSATAKPDPEATRVNMEELYRQWRMFRAKDFETQSADPSFVPNMEKVESSLFAASKLVDNRQWVEARGELLNAQKLLQLVRPVAAVKPGVDEAERNAAKRY